MRRRSRTLRFYQCCWCLQLFVDARYGKTRKFCTLICTGKYRRFLRRIEELPVEKKEKILEYLEAA